MKITVLSVGKIKESYIKTGVDEYIKRLSKFTKTEIIEVPDEKCGEDLSPKEMESVKNKEGEKLLLKLAQGAFIITLEIGGKEISSQELSELLQSIHLNGQSNICFIIGGSLGLGENILAKANYRLSFSKMTFPHQLMRLFLLEQIYRSFKIINNEPYHK